ncbi:MAG: hypothetical protein NTX61_08855 [Bacteroidetes bacterium]|nr:hypothetical protein [Bacteroidota bacterium]
MKRYLCISLFIVSLSGSAQNLNSVKESDIPGITILSGNSFEKENLNKYITSGTELYLEYGFEKLFVNEYTLDKDKARLEVYIMLNAPSAFGIYSMLNSRCSQWNLLGSFSCTTPYKIAAVSGNLFIYTGNKSGTQSGQALCEQLVKVVINNNPQEIWYAPALIQSAKAAPFTNTLRYYKGPLGLKKGLPSWSDMLEDIDFHMYTMNITTPDYSGILARISFTDERNLSAFIRNASLDIMSIATTPVMASNGLYRSWFKINSTKILFLESTSPQANIKDFVPEAPDNKWLVEE